MLGFHPVESLEQKGPTSHLTGPEDFIDFDDLSGPQGSSETHASVGYDSKRMKG